MKSAIAVLTYNRVHALQEELSGLLAHCSQYPIAIFDDLSNRDGTEKFLKTGRSTSVCRPSYLATEWIGESGQPRVFLGDKNLGVAGNSNRALRWFMEETDADHLCLLNDDLHVLGDFVDFYKQGHMDLNVGMFCFCDFTGPSYRWVDIKKRGYTVKLCPRMTGIMVSVMRPVLDRIGYFDAAFGKFGEEHCDWTIRARLSGAIALDGIMQQQLDIHHYRQGEESRCLLKHQEVETSVLGIERQAADKEASAVMQVASQSYRYRHLHRPCKLYLPKFAGGTKVAGIPVDQIESTYLHVIDFTPKPL